MIMLRNAAARLSGLCLVASILSLVALATALMIEVVARYGFKAPTLWAHDLSRFLTAMSFLLAAAWCLKTDSNIRVDVLMTNVSKRKRAIMETCFLAFLLIPTLTVINYASLQRAYSSFVKVEVDPVSPWGPRVWPFFAAIALALVALLIQSVANLVEAVLCAAGRADDNALAAPNSDKVEPV